MSARTDRGEIYLRWNGYRAETSLDPFFNRRDFEGYRVYISRTGHPGDWSMVAQRDLYNYARHTWSEARQRWLVLDPPFSRDSLKSLYDSLCLVHYGFEFDPDSFVIASRDEALFELRFDPRVPDRLDSLYHYFGPFEANAMSNDTELKLAVDNGLGVFNSIRKVYPDSSESTISWRSDGTPFAPYYEYEFALKDLQVAEPLVLAVTAFDQGDPASNFPPLETTQETNAQTVWPLRSAEVVKSERPKPGVYPNPYRLIDDYYGTHWENQRGTELDQERARQVTFYNVPDTCTLSIWSLDGDLVRKIKHYADPAGSEATVVRWDMITRNTQAVKTGIYVWSIESRFGTDVGKLVIIK